MSRFGSQYHIARSTGVCAATGTPLEPGSTCIAALSESTEDEGFIRQDFSVSAWEEGARPERLFSFWRTEVASPNDKPKLLVDDDVLLDLFERLADDERQQRVAFRFVLALILMRKRMLKFIGRVGRDADEVWRLRPRGTDPELPPIEVRNPQLSEDDVRELSAQLGEILRGDL
jgi:hypothetical protein